MSRPEPEPLVVTEVVEEKGRFTVYMEVVFVDQVVRHRIGSHHTRARAELAARFAYQSANRRSGTGREKP